MKPLRTRLLPSLLATPRRWRRRRRAAEARKADGSAKSAGWVQRLRFSLLFAGRSERSGDTEKALRGRQTEAFAASRLRQAGLRILAKNWRAGRDEIDLIAQDGAVVVFVEVRARQKEALVQGAATLSARKRKALRRVTRAYRLKFGVSRWRCDVVEVHLMGAQIISHHWHQGVRL